MFFSIRDAAGEVVKWVDTEEEAKSIVKSMKKEKKEYTYHKVGKVWP